MALWSGVTTSETRGFELRVLAVKREGRRRNYREGLNVVNKSRPCFLCATHVSERALPAVSSGTASCHLICDHDHDPPSSNRDYGNSMDVARLWRRDPVHFFWNNHHVYRYRSDANHRCIFCAEHDRLVLLRLTCVLGTHTCR